jgi:hypothetical protein
LQSGAVAAAAIKKIADTKGDAQHHIGELEEDED